MSKNVLVVATSLRQGGNSETLADEFIRGAKENNKVEKVCLYNKTINFCKGCLVCLKTHRCVIHDDADIIVQKMKDADVIVFATPIYYYEMCGQMKTLLDRANPLYEADYKFMEVYLLASAAEIEEATIDGAVKGLSGWIECFPKAKLSGVIFAGGVDVMGTIHNHPSLEKTYMMGKNI